MGQPHAWTHRRLVQQHHSIYIYNLSLETGRNVLVLSVDGQLPNRIATDTDRLVFKVE